MINIFPRLEFYALVKSHTGKKYYDKEHLLGGTKYNIYTLRESGFPEPEG